MYISTLFLLATCRNTSSVDDSANDSPAHLSTHPFTQPMRLITLTPSLTEIVATLGAVDRLVAVDKYSRNPPQVRDLPVAGDFVAPNIEVIAKLRPDLVLLDQAQVAKTETALRSAGFRTLAIEMHTISDIKSALIVVADALGVSARGTAAVADIDRALESEKRSLENPPKVLWVIDRNPSALAGIIAAGPNTFANELITRVGGTNVLTDKNVRYPKISREALERLHVDLVVDSSGAAQRSMSAWKQASHIPMVAKVRMSIATPSPAVTKALREMGRHIMAAAQRPPRKQPAASAPQQQQQQAQPL